MSKVRQRFVYPEVIGQAMTAQEVIAELTDVHRVEIAGSLRRKRMSIGDIDLVVQVDESNPWVKQSIGSALAGYRWMPVREGERIASYAIPGRVVEIPIDIYYATPETWGITLLVRTGSAGHNIKLAEIGNHRLPTRRLSVARGILNTAGAVVASRTEEECFAALGLAYVPPAQREAPEFDAMVRADEVTA
jgi:DNA polymerase (family X)